MKKITSNNRNGLYTKAALLTLILALLAATPIMAFGHEKPGKFRASYSHLFARPTGLKCYWWWWIRR